MPRKCCVIHCKGNYDSSDSKVTVYGFPNEEEERNRWVRALPNTIKKVTQYIGICASHWPEDTEMVKIKRYNRPINPPSIFPNCLPSNFIQTASSSLRDVENRRVSSSVRSSIPDELETFESLDNIVDWTSFIAQLSSKTFIEDHDLWVVKRSSTDVVKMIHFICENIVDYCVSVTSDFVITSVKQNTRVDIKSVVGFGRKLTKWSQLEAVISVTKSTLPSFEIELNCAAENIERSMQFADIDMDVRRRLEFLLFQVKHMSSRPYEYPASILKVSTELLLAGTKSYNICRKHLLLPHPDTVKKHIGSLKSTGSVADAKDTINAVFHKLVGIQRTCLLLFDEVYITPSARYRGCHLLGRAEDDPNKTARTVLSLMLKPLLSHRAFMVRLIPVFSLTAEFLECEILKLVEIVNECDGKIKAFICDSASVNRSFYKSICSSDNENYLFKHQSTDSYIYCLHDTVHLLKNVRNNWISEKKKEIKFELPNKGTVVAKFSDCIKLYRSEASNIVKRTNLTYQSCFPSSIEKQNVRHVLRVFNEKTVAALVNDGCIDTAKFIDYFLRLWKMLNIKTIEGHIRLNDSDRKPFSDPNDNRIVFLRETAEAISRMPGNSGPYRIQSFTSVTRDAFVQTLRGLSKLIQELLRDEAVKYILPGIFQTDPLEGEFSCYRQMSGGNYYIGLDQLLCSARLRKLKLFEELDIDRSEFFHVQNLCCSKEMSDDELSVIDSLFERSNSLSDNERSSLYYICGYICFKEGIVNDSESDLLTDESGNRFICEFTDLVSRGKLTYPRHDVVYFAFVTYTFFTKDKSIDCGNLLCHRFLYIYESLCFCFPNCLNVCRRLVNCFFKGQVNMSSDELSSSKAAKRKRQKLNS